MEANIGMQTSVVEIEMDLGFFPHYITTNETTILTIFTLTVSGVGICLTVVALVMMFLTAFLFQEWRKVYKNQLLIQFMIARFIYTSIRFINDVFVVSKLEVHWDPIMMYLFLVIYSEMALVTWMYVFSKHMYDSFVKVCNAKNYTLWKISVCAWMMPAGISIFLYGIFKIPRHQDLFFILVYQLFIKWPVLCVNGIQLALILRYILNCNQSNTENNLRIVLLMVLLIFTFSIQQAAGDLIMFFKLIKYRAYEVVPHILTLMNIASLYQCGFTILFWLFGNTNTRKLWKFKGDNEILQLHTINVR